MARIASIIHFQSAIRTDGTLPKIVEQQTMHNDDDYDYDWDFWKRYEDEALGYDLCEEDWWKTHRDLIDIEVEGIKDRLYESTLQAAYLADQILAPIPQDHTVQVRRETDEVFSARDQLIALNRLISHIFGRKLRISDLLRSYGISDRQIERWGRDPDWVMTFLAQFQSGLIDLLETRTPGSDPAPFVLIWLLGLSVEQTVARHGHRAADIVRDQDYFMSYLTSSFGRSDIERLVTLCLHA